MNKGCFGVIFGLLFCGMIRVQAQTSLLKPDPCRTVHGRYSIYVEGDRLWIPGSKHLVEVVSDELDGELQKRGWENTVVYGDFTICGERVGNPMQLTIQDNIVLQGYTKLRFRPR